ncbi:MAG: hypothetical protein PHX41_04785 [Kiritimatiellae bacterium]|nr:hypothetical protein [Kiritimatiellia bacterium]
MTRKNTPSAVPSLVLSAALFTGLSAQAQPVPIYRNDFATRLSAGPAAAKSYTLPYLTGTLCSTTGLAAYSDQNAIQDGWVEGLNNNNAVARVLDTSGNPLACLCSDLYGQHAYARHPIGIVLTNGLVRYSGDLRPPRRWSGSSRNIAIHLGYDRLMSVIEGEKEEYYKYQTLLTGFRSPTGSDTDFKFYAYQGNGDGSSGTYINGTAAADTTHWYRFVALLDLNVNTYTAAVYDMGTEQPTLETPLPASPVETFGGTTFRFHMDLSDATGGLTTLALSAYGVMGGDDASTDITLTARYDNLTIESKPTGTPDFTRVYANDFATRTITRTVPDPLEACYANDTVVPNGTGSYSTGDKLTLDKTLEFPNGSILGSGTDGWIRRNSGTSKITIGSDGNAYARAWHGVGTTFINACQRIGNTVTNGTVQVTVEITPPNQWYWTTSSVFLMIGDDSLYRGEKYDSITNSYYHHYAACVGFGGTGSTDIRFVTFDGNGANNATSVYGTASVNPANWYRFIATLDLTNATFAVDVYDMGTQHSINTPTPETPVQSFAGGFHRRIGDNTLTELQGISAICLGAYGVQGGYAGTNNIPGTAGFDNIILTATLPDAEPVEIYRNPFSSRTYTNITGAARHTLLTGAIDTLGGSQDGWVRRNNGNLPGDVTADGGNPHLRFSTASNTEHAYFMQALGTDITHNVLLAQCDMNPPAYWVWNYHSAALYLGDDRFWQGNRNATLSFVNYYALNFGFGSTSETASYDWGVYLNTSIFASDGDGTGGVSNVFAAASIDAGHWYRFKAEIVPTANTYSLKVYDMGTAQPTLETPTPAEPVAAFDGLRFKTNMRKTGDPEDRLEALSAFSVAGFGVRGSQLFPPEEQVLVDNLLFSVKRTGTMIRIQ